MLRSLLRPSAGLSLASCRATPAAASYTPSLVASAFPPAVLAFAPNAFGLMRTATRGVVVDRAVKSVSLRRRRRRELLAGLARKEARSISAADRYNSTPPPLASYEASAANANQFLAFLAHQRSVREENKALDEEKAKIESLQTVKAVSEPGWKLAFENLKHLMLLPANRNFRACEEILGALSDPTTDLGQRGLFGAEWTLTLAYVRACIDATFDETRQVLFMVDNDFSRLEAEDQYRHAGAHALAYLVGRVSDDPAEAAAALERARAQKIFPPRNTLLYRAMEQDVYPRTDAESLARSEAAAHSTPESIDAELQTAKKHAAKLQQENVESKQVLSAELVKLYRQRVAHASQYFQLQAEEARLEASQRAQAAALGVQTVKTTKKANEAGQDFFIQTRLEKSHQNKLKVQRLKQHQKASQTKQTQTQA